MPLNLTKHPIGRECGHTHTHVITSPGGLVEARLYGRSDSEAETVRMLFEGRKPAAECIAGELIEAGDDDEGHPRLVISATREAIKAGAGNLLFKPVVVVPDNFKAELVYPAVFDEVIAERARQDEQWGGPEHDDGHEDADWWEFILNQYHQVNAQTHRERLVKVAALAVAAIESHDRITKRVVEVFP